MSNFSVLLIQIFPVKARCFPHHHDKVKGTATERLSLLEKVFLLLMGVAKNYIMYWGGYKFIITNPPEKCSQTIFNFYTSFVQKNDDSFQILQTAMAK